MMIEIEIETHFHFKELQIDFRFEMKKWLNEIPFYSRLRGPCSGWGQIWQQLFYLTKLNICDVNL